MKELQKQEIQIPDTWDYEKAVESLKGKILHWKNLTYEIAVELYIARACLKRQGLRTDLVTNVTKSWGDFCKDIDINRMTAHRWISKFFKGETPQIEFKFHDNKYRVIYADPPWKYMENGISGVSAVYDISVDKHYPQMSIEQICKLPVNEIADDNAVLFLWVTTSFLEKSFEVIKAWGFEYKTSFVWYKKKHNFGYYNSVRHEFLLICTKGSCTPDSDKLVNSVQIIERSKKHSEKPEEFRRIIDTLYPYGNRIELFARETKEGWETWGNEIQQ